MLNSHTPFNPWHRFSACIYLGTIICVRYMTVLDRLLSQYPRYWVEFSRCDRHHLSPGIGLVTVRHPETSFVVNLQYANICEDVLSESKHPMTVYLLLEGVTVCVLYGFISWFIPSPVDRCFQNITTSVYVSSVTDVLHSGALFTACVLSIYIPTSVACEQ